MKIVNTTSMSTKRLEELIAFVDEDERNISWNRRETVFKFKKSKRRYAGRIFFVGCSYSPEGYGRHETLIIVRSKEDAIYPCIVNTWSKRLVRYKVRNREEMVLSVIAHELKHLNQFIHNKPSSETECEHYAKLVLEAYRETIKGDEKHECN